MGATDSDGFKMRLWFGILSLFFLVSSSNAFFNLLFGFGGRGNRGRRPASSYGAPSRPTYNAAPSYSAPTYNAPTYNAPTYNAPSKPSYNSPSSYYSPSPSSSYDSPTPQRELPTPPQISYGGFQSVHAQSSYNAPAPAQSSYNSPASSPVQSSGDSYGSPAAPAQSSYSAPAPAQSSYNSPASLPVQASDSYGSPAAPAQSSYSAPVSAAQPNYGK